MTKENLKIGLDIDDTVVYWMDAYLDRFGNPKNDFEVTKRVQNVLKYDKNFWMNLSIKNVPDFNPTLYCTARVIKKDWTRQYITEHQLPKAPIYQVYGYGLSKVNHIKGRVDVFIDDSVHHFIDLNKHGVCCLLMDSEFNRHFETPYRIHSLNLDEIFEIYHAMKGGY